MNKTRKLTLLGIMLSLMMVLSMVERMLPPMPFMPVQVRLGLANVISMYAVFFMSYKEALFLTVAKAVLIMMLRSPIAGVLSLSGGLLSVFVVLFLSKTNTSVIFISIASAIAHNLGQLFMTRFILGNHMILYQLPWLIIAGIILGLVTGMVLEMLLPIFHQVFIKNEKEV